MSFTGGTFGNYSRMWLIITGVILLVVGGGMAITLGSLPFAGSMMIVTGGILAVVGIALIVVGLIVGRRAAAVNQLLATGIPGTAQIMGMTQTGMYLNEQPQVSLDLMVTVQGRPPYAATHKSFVPLILLGRLTSGAPLAVRIDPADPQKVVVDWQSSGAIAQPMMPMAGMQPMMGQQMMGAAPMQSGPPTGPGSGVDESLGQVQAALAASGIQAANPYSMPGQQNLSVEQLRAYLRQSGLQATATVDSLQDAGQVVGDERLFTMEMTLNIPGQAPKKLAKSAAMVPILSAHKIRQGMTVPVRYAAENPDLLMVEWDKI